jgi:hypothetical protein
VLAIPTSIATAYDIGIRVARGDEAAEPLGRVCLRDVMHVDHRRRDVGVAHVGANV